jgi:hypothetical protein
MAISITDVNDGTVYSIDKQDVAAIYELTDYRIVRMDDGKEYDVTETFATLIADVGPGPGP